MINLKIPVGISDFEKIRKNQYYFVDKSGLIEELLNTESNEVTLITRPRRFWKNAWNEYAGKFFRHSQRQQRTVSGTENFPKGRTVSKMDESVSGFIRDV